MGSGTARVVVALAMRSSGGCDSLRVHQILYPCSRTVQAAGLEPASIDKMIESSNLSRGTKISRCGQTAKSPASKAEKLIEGSTPSSGTKSDYGAAVARLSGGQEVGGSIPPNLTKLRAD